MKENTTVVCDHYRPNAQQLGLFTHKSLKHRMKRSFGTDERIDYPVGTERASRDWLVDMSSTGPMALHQWQNLGLKPSRLYQALVPSTSTDAKALVEFSLSTEFHANDCWFAILCINHVTSFGVDVAPVVLFASKDHCGDVLEIVVAPRSNGWSMTLNGGQMIDVLGPELVDAICSIVTTLNHRAEKQCSFHQCAQH